MTAKNLNSEAGKAMPAATSAEFAAAISGLTAESKIELRDFIAALSKKPTSAQVSA